MVLGQIRGQCTNNGANLSTFVTAGLRTTVVLYRNLSEETYFLMKESTQPCYFVESRVSMCLQSSYKDVRGLYYPHPITRHYGANLVVRSVTLGVRFQRAIWVGDNWLDRNDVSSSNYWCYQLSIWPRFTPEENERQLAMSMECNPTPVPTKAPTLAPTDAPTGAPTDLPTTSPSQSPSLSPTKAPTDAPTTSPTQTPSLTPTTSPTVSPSTSPSVAPSVSPSKSPSRAPSQSPSTTPTTSPSTSPTTAPSTSPSTTPTVSPSQSPSTSPTDAPSVSPTVAPTPAPTLSPIGLMLNGSSIEDTYVNGDSKATVYADSTVMLVEIGKSDVTGGAASGCNDFKGSDCENTDNGCSNTRYAFIRFNVSDVQAKVLDGYEVENATLILHMAANGAGATVDSHTCFYQVSSSDFDIAYSGLNFNSLVSPVLFNVSAHTSNYVELLFQESLVTEVHVDITAMMVSWTHDGAPNYGLAVMMYRNADDHEISISSSEAGANGPKVMVALHDLGVVPTPQPTISPSVQPITLTSATVDDTYLVGDDDSADHELSSTLTVAMGAGNRLPASMTPPDSCTQLMGTLCNGTNDSGGATSCNETRVAFVRFNSFADDVQHYANHNYTLHTAYMRLYETTVDRSGALCVYQLSAAALRYQPHNMSWSVFGGFDSSVHAARVVNASIDGTGVYDIDITTMVDAWVNGGEPNYGVALLTHTTATATDPLEFASAQHPSANGPVLMVHMNLPPDRLVTIITPMLSDAHIRASDMRFEDVLEISSNDDKYALMYFDLSTVAAAALDDGDYELESAALTITASNNNDMAVGLYMIDAPNEFTNATTDCTAATVPCSDLPAHLTSVGAIWLSPGESNLPMTAMITAMVEKWLTGAVPNRGMLLTYVSGSNSNVKLHSSRQPTISYRPRLDLVFRASVAPPVQGTSEPTQAPTSAPTRAPSESPTPGPTLYETELMFNGSHIEDTHVDGNSKDDNYATNTELVIHTVNGTQTPALEQPTGCGDFEGTRCEAGSTDPDDCLFTRHTFLRIVDFEGAVQTKYASGYELQTAELTLHMHLSVAIATPPSLCFYQISSSTFNLSADTMTFRSLMAPPVLFNPTLHTSNHVQLDTLTSTTHVPVVIDITSMVSAWTQDGAPNYGIMMMMCTSGSSQSIVYIASNEYTATPWYTPKLTVKFHDVGVLPTPAPTVTPPVAQVVFGNLTVDDTYLAGDSYTSYETSESTTVRMNANNTQPPASASYSCVELEGTSCTGLDSNWCYLTALAFIRFNEFANDIQARIATGYTVRDAYIRLRVESSVAVGSPRPLCVHQLSSALHRYRPYNMSWTEFGGFNARQHASRVVETSIDGTATYDVDITAIMNAWVSGGEPNYGVVLMTYDTSVIFTIRSSEYTTDTSHRPQLIVNMDTPPTRTIAIEAPWAVVDAWMDDSVLRFDTEMGMNNDDDIVQFGMVYFDLTAAADAFDGFFELESATLTLTAKNDTVVSIGLFAIVAPHTFDNATTSCGDVTLPCGSMPTYDSSYGPGNWTSPGAVDTPTTTSVTMMVYKWLKGLVENRGMVLVYQQGTGAYTDVYSSRASTAAYRPRLDLVFSASSTPPPTPAPTPSVLSDTVLVFDNVSFIEDTYVDGSTVTTKSTSYSDDQTLIVNLKDSSRNAPIATGCGDFEGTMCEAGSTKDNDCASTQYSFLRVGGTFVNDVTAKYDAGYELESAVLTLHGNVSDIASQPLGVCFYQISSSSFDLDLSTMTFNSLMTPVFNPTLHTSSFVESYAFNETSSSPVDIDITNMVSAWTQGGAPNYGIVIMLYRNPSSVSLQIASTEDASHIPKLTVKLHDIGTPPTPAPTIAPSVVALTLNYTIVDTYLKGNDNTDYSGSNTIQVDMHSARIAPTGADSCAKLTGTQCTGSSSTYCTDVRIAFVRIDGFIADIQSRLATSHTVSSAYLRLYKTSTTSAATLCLFQISTASRAYDTGDTMTWSTFSGFNSRDHATRMAEASVDSASGNYDIDITAMVNGWVDGENNYGIAIMTHVSADSKATFASSEDTTESRRPQFIVYLNAPSDRTHTIEAPAAVASACVSDNAMLFDNQMTVRGDATQYGVVYFDLAVAADALDGGFELESATLTLTTKNALVKTVGLFAIVVPHAFDGSTTECTSSSVPCSGYPAYEAADGANWTSPGAVDTPTTITVTVMVYKWLRGYAENRGMVLVDSDDLSADILQVYSHTIGNSMYRPQLQLVFKAGIAAPFTLAPTSAPTLAPTLSPTELAFSGGSYIEDTYVYGYSTNRGSNYGGISTMYMRTDNVLHNTPVATGCGDFDGAQCEAGNSGYCSALYYSFLKIHDFEDDVQAKYAAGYELEKAELTLYMKLGASVTTAPGLCYYQISSSAFNLSASTMTFNSLMTPMFNATLHASNHVQLDTFTSTSYVPVVIDITSMVSAWTQGGVPNYGIMMMMYKQASTLVYAYIYTSEYTSNPTYMPKLTVKFHDIGTPPTPAPTVTPAPTLSPTEMTFSGGSYIEDTYVIGSNKPFNDDGITQMYMRTRDAQQITPLPTGCGDFYGSKCEAGSVVTDDCEGIYYSYLKIRDFEDDVQAKYAAGYELENAELTLYMGLGGAVTTAPGFCFYQISSSSFNLSASTMTFNSLMAPPIAFNPALHTSNHVQLDNFTSAASVPVVLDITSMVSAWTQGGAPNYGVMIMMYKEPTPLQYVYTYTSEGTAASRPKLTVKFHDVNTPTPAPTVTSPGP